MKKHLLLLSILLIVSSNIFGAGPGITVHNNSGKKVWVKADKQLDKTKQSFNKEASVSNGYVSIEKGKQERIKTDSGDRGVEWIFENDKNTNKEEISFGRGYRTKKTFTNPDDLTIIGDQGAYVMIERAFGKRNIKDEYLAKTDDAKKILQEQKERAQKEAARIEKIETIAELEKELEIQNKLIAVFEKTLKNTKISKDDKNTTLKLLNTAIETREKIKSRINERNKSREIIKKEKTEETSNLIIADTLGNKITVPKETTCVICSEDITTDKDNGKIVKLKCGHIFHKECIDQWFNTDLEPKNRWKRMINQVRIKTKHNECPLCRAIVKEDYNKKYGKKI